MENQIVITVEGIVWFCGAIVAIGGATAVISRWVSPFRKLKLEVENLKKEFITLKGYQNADHKELQKIETGTEKICKCVLAITDHELTGNSVDKLRKAKDEMQDFLIEK